MKLVFFLVLVLEIVASCTFKDKQQCRWVEVTNAELDIDSIGMACEKLLAIRKKGIGLAFWLADSIPPSKQFRQISCSFFCGDSLDRNATVIIGVRDHKFSVFYSDSLLTDEFLIVRERFDRSIFNAFQRPFSSTIFDSSIKYFNVHFSR